MGMERLVNPEFCEVTCFPNWSKR